MPYSQSETPHSYQNAGPRTDANESSDSDEDQQFDPALHGSIDWNNMLSMPREVFWDGQTAGGLSIRHQVPFAAAPHAFLYGLLMLVLVTFARQLPFLFQPRERSTAGETDDDFAGNDALAVTMLALLAMIVRACANSAAAAAAASTIGPIAPRSPHESEPWYHFAQFGLGMGALSVMPNAWQAHNQWQAHTQRQEAQRLQHVARQWFGEELQRVETALAITEQLWPPAMLADSSPFLKLNELAQRAALSDAKVLIDSPKDERKRWWAQAFEFVPIPFLDGILKMSLSKTTEEFNAGLGSFGLDLLLTAIPGQVLGYIPFTPRAAVSRTTVRLVGGKSAAATKSVLKKFDSFFKPPALVNGRRGYLLSPVSAMHLPDETLMKYIVKVESLADLDALETGTFSNLSPSTLKKLEYTHTRLIDDAEESFLLRAHVLQKRGRPGVRLPEGKTRLKDVIPDLFADEKYTGGDLGKGLVINEQHDMPAVRKAIYDSMVSMKKSGIKTLFIEWALHEENEEALDAFFRTGHVSDVLRKTFDDADAVVKFGIGEDRYAMEELAANARAQGIRLVGLDTHSASSRLPSELLSEGALENRQTGFNFYAEQVIRKHQAANGNQPWVAVVGYKHGVEAPRFHGSSGSKIPGMGQLLDAMAIYITTPVEAGPWLQMQVVLDPELEISMTGKLAPEVHKPNGYEGRILTA